MVRYAKGYLDDAPTGIWKCDFDAKAESWKTNTFIAFVYKGLNSLVLVTTDDRVFYYRFLKFPAQPKAYRWMAFVKTM